jgi:hypothetical protein
VRKGPTSHLPLHDDRQTDRQTPDTIEIPPTEILGRISNEVQGELEFSEGTSAKCIFDVEIEKLRAEVFNM